MKLNNEIPSTDNNEALSFVDFSEKEAMDCFVETFKKEWEDMIEEVLFEQYLYIEEEDKNEIDRFKECNPCPIDKIQRHEEGYRILLKPVYIKDRHDSFAYIREPQECLDNTTRIVKSMYPDTMISGCIQFEWSDSQGSGYERYSIGEAKMKEIADSLLAFMEFDEEFEFNNGEQD